MNVQKLVSARFVWPRIHRDILKYTGANLACQRSKIDRHTRTPHMFFHVFASFRTRPYRYSRALAAGSRVRLYFNVDRFTPILLSGITTAIIVRAIVAGWISRIEDAANITADRGRQIESSLTGQLTTLLGCKRTRTTAYPHVANWPVECPHRQLKTALRTMSPPDVG